MAYLDHYIERISLANPKEPIMIRLASSEIRTASEAYARGFRHLIPPEDLHKVAIAYRFAAFIHQGETRCDKQTPFLQHPLATTDIRVNELGLRWLSPEDRVAAVVTLITHDCPESNPELFSYSLSAMLFGDGVAFNLDLLRKKPDQSRDDYYGGLMSCDKPEPVIDKLCDNLHNSRTLGLCPEEFQLRQIAETDRHYVPLAKHLIEILPADLKWIGRYLLENLQAICSSYKREFELEKFPPRL